MSACPGLGDAAFDLAFDESGVDGAAYVVDGYHFRTRTVPSSMSTSISAIVRAEA